MKSFTNSLNDIKIASPCPANWDEMYGDDRKRFCSECKLNVYNLSDMTGDEAESFLINSEGGVCVKFYRRKDGSVITKNCPVGLEKIKRRISKTFAAAFGLIIGICTGFLPFTQYTNNGEELIEHVRVEDENTEDLSLNEITSEEPLEIRRDSEMLMGRPDISIMLNKPKR